MSSFGFRRGIWLFAFACSALVAQSGAEAQSGPISPIARAVTFAVGFDEDDLQRVWDGEIVSRAIGERSEKELAIAVIMRLDESHEEFYERVRDGQFFEIDRTVSQVERIPPTSQGPAVFENLRLAPDELRRLGRAKPGSELNLSRSEIEALNEAAPAGEEALSDAYRVILAGRLHSYRASGIEGIAPFARRRGKTARPADDLLLAVSSLSALDERCPTFYRAFSGYPLQDDPNVSHQFFWAVQRIQKRPTVILSHWALQRHDEFAVVGERQFYVGQGYDSLQIVVGAFGLGEGESLVFYVNRTTTDEVTGFSRSLAHRIGRKLMLNEVIALFREVRASVAARN